MIANASVPVPPGRQQAILGALLLDANRVVSGDWLIEAIWDGDPPSTARSQVQNCVSALRQIFRRLGEPSPIVTSPPGYRMRVPDHLLDVGVFGQLTARAATAERAGRLEEAVDLLREALALWRGPVLGGEVSRPLRARAARLDEERLGVLEERIDLDLRLGRHRRLVGEISGLVEEYPLRERLRGLLMLALYRCGRPAEALAVYRAGRVVKVANVGLEPGKELKRLHAAILAEDDALLSGHPGPGGADPKSISVPHQLPSGIADFVDRESLIEQAESVLSGENERAPGLRILVITGKAGVGKSTLAVHVAHRMHADHFADGQLYCNVAGMGAAPATPADVLGRFLRALGVPGAGIPDDLNERTEMYRTLLGGRRMLIVLDDVTSETQIVPLLPGSDRCAVIVTSRARLTGVPGARLLKVDTLSTAQAVRLIGNVIGFDRVREEAGAADALVRLVGGLPLAVRILAVRLAARPHWSLATMLKRLADDRHRLDELSYGDMGVRASLRLTYDALPPHAARLFRLLGLVAVESLPMWVVAALLDDDTARSADALELLVDSQLVDVVVTPHSRPRFVFHDIIRLFARELLADDQQERAATTALERVLGGWLAQVQWAHRKIYGGDFTVLRGSAPRLWLNGGHMDGVVADPLNWLETERQNLCLAVGQAADYGLSELSWELAVSLVTLFEAHSYFDDWQQTHLRALSAVQEAGNRRGEAALLCSLGSLHLSRNRLGSARSVLSRAQELFEELGDIHGLAMTLRNLSLLYYVEGDTARSARACRQALDGFRQKGDLVGHAHVLGQVARIDLDAGRYESAVDRLNTALAICREVNVPRVEAQTRHRLGEVLFRQRRYDQAKLVMGEVLAVVRSDNDLVGEGYALHTLGLICAETGDNAESERLLRAAIDIRERIMDFVGAARVSLDLAALLDEWDASGEAITLAERAVRTFADRKVPVWEDNARDLLGTLLGARRSLGRRASGL
ncbi:DNA-binding SARP family transcriptional activator [Kibdelosporangium banguiense]|uniref:DNA-binding SARP family transcriptional activator n=1 Tax=Kibdelosporangium banguiense TaxID=1365924 RepID=A0ABS4TVU1_9PSEU|nr:AfsR/SARP family transcriptional regulator [Kibdelosporangium banguiense]MBP2328515.1 DNA-binding SARP family transcriptional activator [Kibdelosporangium banguiense]